MEEKRTNLTVTSKSNYQKSIWINAIEVSIIGLIILVSIAFYPWCITVFIPAKEMVAELLVIIGLMFWGFKIIDRGKLSFLSNTINFPVISYMLISILSLIWSQNIFSSLKELPLFLAGPLLYFIVINNIDNPRQINRIVNILLTVGALFGIYGILQYMGIDFSIWSRNIGRQRVFGLFGNVNFFAEYLIIPLPIAVALFFVSESSKLRKALLLVAVLAMSASLVLTFTRGSYLAFFVAFIFMFILFFLHWQQEFIKNNKKLFIGTLAAIIVIVSLFIIPNPISKNNAIISQIKSRISPAKLVQDTSFKRRVATWKFTLLMINDHPLLGSGIGTYKYNTLRYQAEFFSQGKNRSLYPHGFADKAHNEYLQLWAEMGIIGLGIFIWLIITYFSYELKVLRNTKEKYKQGMIIGLMGAVVGVLVDAIFGFPLHLPATVILFWLVVGLSVVLGSTEISFNDYDSLIIPGNGSKIKKIEKTKIEQKKKVDRNSKNIRKNSIIKPVLYICIILLSAFLSTIAVRPFIARTYWFYAEKERSKSDIGINDIIKNYFKALKWDPYLGEVYYDIGKILMNDGYYTPALNYLEKAEKYVDLPDLPLDLARSYINKGMLDKAAIKLGQAITYQSNERLMLPLYSELGDIYLKLGKYKQAELTFQDALKINDEFVNAHFGLAIAYLNQNLPDKSLLEFQKVIELAPDSIEADYAKKIIQQFEKNVDSKE